jgi:ribose 1,5-bisphosphokinase
VLSRPQAAAPLRHGVLPPRLVYLMGPSGGGKDSLLAHARARLTAAPGVIFAHRYITRPADAGGENHVALARDEFVARRDAGLFALHWESHGLCYGIGLELDLWLSKGTTVVVNGSREHLPQARARYPGLLAVRVTVDAAVLERRLRARGREDEADIARRLQRAQDPTAASVGEVILDNSGPLARAGEALVTLITLGPDPHDGATLQAACASRTVPTRTSVHSPPWPTSSAPSTKPSGTT